MSDDQAASNQPVATPRPKRQPSRKPSPGDGLERSRLPLHHPDYRYPPARNPYSKRLEEFRGKVFSDNETEQFAGRWRSLFPAPGNGPELHVEIGCNAGHVVLEWAARNPENAYIGLDWKFKPIFWGVEKAKKRGIENLIFLRAHAGRLEYMFGPGEIDGLYLYFPDPWPKKSQMKNRFLTAERIRKLAAIVKPGGIFHIKTDHKGYFAVMEEALDEVLKDPGCPWQVLERTRDLHANHPDPRSLTIPEVTLFERLFIKDGININSIRLKRC